MFEAFDDGLTTTAAGGVSVIDANGVEIYPFNGNYGTGFSVQFRSGAELSINDNALEGISVYPNPINNVLNIKNATNSSIEVLNMLGQTLITKNNITVEEQVNVASFPQGTYFVKITNGNVVKTEKFIVSK